MAPGIDVIEIAARRLLAPGPESSRPRWDRLARMEQVHRRLGFQSSPHRSPGATAGPSPTWCSSSASFNPRPDRSPRATHPNPRQAGTWLALV